jgi:hypothetical protein
MKRLFSARSLLAATVAVGAVVAASAAHARTDVVVSIGVQQPYGYVQSAPVYVQPQSYYVQPQTYYVQPQPTYYGSRRHVQRRGAWGDADRDGVPNLYDRDSRYYGRAHDDRRGGPRGDADGDGVANRYDHAPYNPYRR